MPLLTRAQMRDGIRRRLKRVPAADVGLGDVGEPLPSQPWPANATINAAIEEALAEINRRCRMGVRSEPLQIDVTAQTDEGPYRVNLAYAAADWDDAAITGIDDCWYVTSGGDTCLLQATSRDQHIRDNPEHMTAEPGTPQYYWLDGTVLNLWPAPSDAGTIYILAGDVLKPPKHDLAYIDGLNPDEYPVVMDIVARDLAVQMGDDAEMQAVAAFLGPKAESGLRDLLIGMTYKNKKDRPHVSLGVSYRR